MPSLPASWYENREAIALPRAIAAFREFVSLPERTEPLLIETAVEERRHEIAALPGVEFKGRHLKATICTKCKKQRNIYPSRLWLVVDVHHVICAFCHSKG